jgi:hypothetical protein
MVAYESGMRNFDAGFPVLRAQSFTYGIMKATMGVLFNTDDIDETVTIIRNRKAFGDRPGLNTRENASEPKMLRIPAVASISRKMMII